MWFDKYLLNRYLVNGNVGFFDANLDFASAQFLISQSSEINFAICSKRQLFSETEQCRNLSSGSQGAIRKDVLNKSFYQNYLFFAIQYFAFLQNNVCK